MYWDSSHLAPGEQGCWKVARTDTTRLKASTFVPESSVDIDAQVEVTNVERAANGGVRLTASFSCAYDFTNDPNVEIEVRQGTRAGYAYARTWDDVPCDGGDSFTRSFVATPPQNRPFVKGAMVVDVDWVQDYEGGGLGLYTGLHRLR